MPEDLSQVTTAPFMLSQEMLEKMQEKEINHLLHQIHLCQTQRKEGSRHQPKLVCSQSNSGKNESKIMESPFWVPSTSWGKFPVVQQHWPCGCFINAIRPLESKNDLNYNFCKWWTGSSSIAFPFSKNMNQFTMCHFEKSDAKILCSFLRDYGFLILRKNKLCT